VRRLRTAVCKSLVKANDVVVTVATGRRHETDPRLVSAGETENVIVEDRARLHGEAAATQRDDVLVSFRHGSSQNEAFMTAPLLDDSVAHAQ
jgi:hypothetical protein